MAFHNSPEGFKGVQPLDEHVLIHPTFHIAPHERDGLFYRSDLQIDVDGAVDKLLQADGEATIQEYQYWAETGWKRPHGSYEAVERFGDKLYEEHQEFSVEARKVCESGQATNIDDIVSEAGDVLWCATALACVSTADIDSGFKNLLYRYVMGIQYVQDMQIVEAPWRGTAAALATKFGQTKISDIDGLIMAGFEPLPSSVMNIFDPDGDEWDIPEHLLQSVALCAAIRNQTEQQFGYGEELGSTLEIYQTGGSFKKKARHIGELVAGLCLETSFILQRTTGKKLADALAGNTAKISGRISTNTVDKTDGGRV